MIFSFSFFLLTLSCIMFILIIYKYNKKKIQNRYKILTTMHKNNNYTILVHTGAGLGNRLMSVVGIIIVSIYYESKPISIYV